MSYDLFFRTDREPPPVGAVRSWLAARPSVTVTGGLALYRDEATGVSFRFELHDEVRPGEAPVSFVMQLPRAGIQALVAEAEVGALVAAFGLGVFDPQPEGMADGRWSRDGFLRGWRAANAAACRDLVRARPDAPVPVLPAAANAAVLAWNRARDAYADRLSAVESLPCTVPAVLLLSAPGDERTVLTGVVWDGEPAAIPEVDLVIACAPPAVREAGERRSRGPGRCIPLVALRPWLGHFEHRPAGHRFGRDGRSHLSGLPHWVADTDGAPAGLVDALRALGTVRALERVSPEQVLDRDTVEAARAAFRTPAGATPRFG